MRSNALACDSSPTYIHTRENGLAIFWYFYAAAVVAAFGVFNTVFFSLPLTDNDCPQLTRFCTWNDFICTTSLWVFCFVRHHCPVYRWYCESRLIVDSLNHHLPHPPFAHRVAWVACLRCVRAFPINQARLSFGCCRCLFSFCRCHARNLHALLARSEVTVTTRLQP